MKDSLFELLASDRFTEAEKAALRWLYGDYGSFQMALFKAISRADDINREKLRQVYPLEVEGFISWSLGTLAAKMEAK